MQKVNQLVRQTLALGVVATALASPFALAETTVGGYGELHYNNLDKNGTDSASIDFHRYVLFIEHEFNNKTRFVSEFELEHALAGDGKPGEVELEQAYVEIDLDKNSNVKTGVFLIPVGILNETHEPTTFYGVERNPVEKNIIPTTWWEAGVMYSANTDAGISYDVAIHSGLNEAAGAIRDGRQKVAKANAESLAYTARVKYTGTPGLEVAGSVNVQDDMSQGTVAGGVGATLVTVHAKYKKGALGLIALHAAWDVDVATDLKGQSGTVLEASYKVSEKMGVFVRQDSWTNDNGVSDKTQSNLGVNYWPHEDVVFKFDIQAQNSDAGNADGFNLGVGYQF